MRPQNRHTVRTTFGTVIGAINQTEGMFRLTKNETVLLDTPLEDAKGTKKTFMDGSIVRGTLWLEVNQKMGKQRKVIMVDEENGRYLIPTSALKPTSELEVDTEKEVSALKEKVEELSTVAKDSVEKVKTEATDFLDKKYGGFTGKQILVGAAAVIIIVKLFK